MTEISRDTQVAFLRNLMRTMILGIVECEDEVEIKEHIMERRICWEVFLDESDMGLAIGREAAHIAAIRTILQVASKKTTFKFDLELIGKSS